MPVAPGFFHEGQAAAAWACLETHLRGGAGLGHNRRQSSAVAVPMPPLPHALPPARRPAVLWALRLGLVALVCLPALAAAQLSATARQEVDWLLRTVGSSGCEFLRGGTAYSAAKAQEHLRQKFDYLDARGQLKSAEDFIVKAGTRSSMTGEAYGIRCPNSSQQASDAWLHTHLKALRQSKS